MRQYVFMREGGRSLYPVISTRIILSLYMNMLGCRIANFYYCCAFSPSSRRIMVMCISRRRYFGYLHYHIGAREAYVKRYLIPTEGRVDDVFGETEYVCEMCAACGLRAVCIPRGSSVFQLCAVRFVRCACAICISLPYVYYLRIKIYTRDRA